MRLTAGTLVLWLTATASSALAVAVHGLKFARDDAVPASTPITPSCPRNVEIAQLQPNGSLQQPSLSEDMLPGFGCRFNFRSGGTVLTKVDVLVNIVVGLANLALDDFEAYVPIFQSQLLGNEIRFRSVGGVMEGEFQTKTIMWSMRALSCWLNERDSWAETNFQCYVEPNLLGFGHLRRTIRAAQDDRTQIIPSSTTQDVAKRSQGDNEITITNIEVVQAGYTFKPFDIFSVFINVLIALGEWDPDDHPSALSVYNPEIDLGFALGATSRQSTGNLPTRYMIAALSDLAEQLPHIRQRDLQWKEFTFLVRNDGRIIGTGVMKKGRVGPAEMLLQASGEDAAHVEVS